ncbi:MAG: PAS domain S-box protein [Thermodesulfobacteriota bacterium]
MPLTHDHCWQALAAMADPVLVIDPRFRVLFMNEAARRLYPAAALDQGEAFCYAISHGRDRPCQLLGEHCPLQEVTATGQAVRIVHDHSRPGEAPCFVEVSAAPLRDETGAVIAVVETLREVNNQALVRTLEESQIRFRRIMESAPDGMITTDAAGVIVDCNQAAGRMFGYAPGELVGQPIDRLLPEHQGVAAALAVPEAEATEPAAAGGRVQETIGRHRSGAELPVEISLAAWSWGGKRFFSSIIRDITDRKRLENALQEEKGLLEQSRYDLMARHTDLQALVTLVEKAKREWEGTVDCIADMVALANSEGRILRCNRAFAELVEVPVAQIWGERWQVLLARQGLAVDPAGAQGQEHYHAGSGRWLAVSLYPIQPELREGPAGRVVTIHDITEIKRISQELEEKNRQIEGNRQNLQGALDQVSTLIRQVAQDGRFDTRFVNPDLTPCWQRLACSRTDCPCHGREPVRCWQLAGTFCRGKAQGEFAAKLGNCMACTHYRSVVDDPIAAIGEQFNNMMYMLEGKNQELERAYNDLKQTQAQLLQGEKMASIGQLAAGVAHEINNPIGFVTSNLASLGKYVNRLIELVGLQEKMVAAAGSAEGQEQVAAARQRLKIPLILTDLPALLAETQEGLDRVRKITTDLKGFARLDGAERQFADLNACLESTITIAWNELKYKATLVRDFGDLPLVECFPQRLNQVFLNLLMNAAQAINGKGEITVRTWQEGDDALISIRDTGCGIPAEHIGRIFEPFFTTKEVGKGTGLGLSIVYDIVTKSHGGAITVASEPGQGTVFTVRLPMRMKAEG